MEPSPTAKTRTLSLRAPVATEEERELFQRRLRLVSLVVFVLTGSFFAVMMLVLAVIHPERVRQQLFDQSGIFHVLTSSLAGAVFLFVRTERRSARVLDVLDVVMACGMCLGFTFMVMRRELALERPEMIALLACTYTLVARAALMPSTPFRTAVVTAVAMSPTLPACLWVFAEGYSKTSPMHPAIFDAIWILMAVGSTTVISRVIYGLRLEIRKAMQLGQYVLEDKIGEGGMGVVYRARHALLRRPTAIKLLPKGQGVERFEREVRITAGLTHPNTIAVFDYGRTPEGVFYYAMEYLDGMSLDHLVATHGAQQPSRVVHVLLQMCGALEEAHAAGLVHRDIKPANVMLTERGGIRDVVKVLDFGLVKESTMTADEKLSGVSSVVGTPQYMAPEAVTDPEHVDPRADIYALGAVAYYLLTGDHVFRGASVIEVLSKHLTESPVAPSERRKGIPAELERVVLACLAKDRDDRPKHAATVAAMLRACNLPEWTREDAAAWWASEGSKEAAVHRASEEHATTIGASLALGDTVTIDMGARDTEEIPSEVAPERRHRSQAT